jgi:hypothetical protein
MKITELLAPFKTRDTTSSATTSSAILGDQTQDVVPQDIASGNMLALEVAPTKGFRCSSGPRKGRIVAKPSTCFAKTDPQKSAKIRKKRLAKAKVAGKKMAQTKRSGGGSVRLKGAQIKRAKQKGPGFKAKTKARAPIKSRIIKPKK